MNAGALLAKEYYTLVKSGLGKFYRQFLVENKEGIDIKATEQKVVDNIFNKRNKRRSFYMRVLRNNLISWLNMVFFNLSSLDDKWWFEFSQQVRKAIIVAIILEKHGGTPDKHTIPQCFVYIYDKIEKVEKNFDKMKKELVCLIDKYPIFKLYTTVEQSQKF